MGTWVRRVAAAVWHGARRPLGVVLVGLGFLGLVLPIVPGVPLLIAGAALLGREHPLTLWLAERAARWPSLARLLRFLTSILPSRNAGALGRSMLR